MPRKRKDSCAEECGQYKRFRYSEEALLEAVREIKEGTISLNNASCKYNIPKGTLHNKIKGKVPLKRKMGPSTVLTDEEERHVANWIINIAKLGFSLHAEDVKDSIQGFLTEFPRENPFTNNRPGNKWMSLFLKRHPEISKRNTEAISRAPAFEDRKKVMNCDETVCCTCPEWREAQEKQEREKQEKELAEIGKIRQRGVKEMAEIEKIRQREEEEMAEIEKIGQREEEEMAEIEKIGQREEEEMAEIVKLRQKEDKKKEQLKNKDDTKKNDV